LRCLRHRRIELRRQHLRPRTREEVGVPWNFDNLFSCERGAS
jgi:hypothetical protein